MKREMNTKFDTEYATQWIEERDWLTKHGIRYCFYKTVNGLDTYKYKKNYELFQCLADFYHDIDVR